MFSIEDSFYLQKRLRIFTFMKGIMISLEILIAQVLFRERIVKLICLLLMIDRIMFT